MVIKMGQTYRRTSITDRRRKRQLEVRKQLMLMIGIVLAIFVLIGMVVHSLRDREASTRADDTITNTKYIDKEPQFDVQLLQINDYSRPGIAIDKVNGIVVHYTANPGTTARQNRDYFDGLATSHATYASSHFVIGLGGEIIQCIPCNEMSYASNERNGDTISIECCIADESGKFNDATYQSLIQLTTWLMGRYDLSTDDVIRHYDVTGKACPKYFVDHPAAWEQFHEDLVEYIDRYGVEKEKNK